MAARRFSSENASIETAGGELPPFSLILSSTLPEILEEELVVWSWLFWTYFPIDEGKTLGRDSFETLWLPQMARQGCPDNAGRRAERRHLGKRKGWSIAAGSGVVETSAIEHILIDVTGKCKLMNEKWSLIDDKLTPKSSWLNFLKGSHEEEISAKGIDGRREVASGADHNWGRKRSTLRSSTPGFLHQSFL